VANIKSFPNNQDEYVGAEYVMRWLHGRSSGVFGADGNASVAPVLDAMAVTVSDGNGWISNDNADGVVWWIDNEKANGSKLQLTVDMADAVLPRIDRVVVSWQTTNYVALPEVKILKGTAASTPVAPELTNNNVLRQISLAAIRVPAGATAITSAMITDERLDPAVCGLVTSEIGIDTTTMQNQFEALLKSIQTELAELEDGTAFEFKKRLFSNVTVPVSAFVADAAYEEQGYGFRAAVALDGVIDSMIPEVIFGMSDAVSGIFSPVAETYNGGVYIYSARELEEAVTIPTIICWKGAA
jgi:hypothetical protein